MASSDLAELISHIGIGDRKAFRKLYELTSPKLFAVCMRVLREQSEAEDALQEVYVKIWHNALRFSAGEYSPISWLAAIARNHAIDRARSRKPQAIELDDSAGVADELPDPEHALLAKSEGKRIERCLEELQQQRAEAIRAAYVEGYSYQELASRYGIPLNTIRTWLRRSLLSLKECLQR
ncbi:sigma-70 family RNA polymerase sigma factor [Aestuariivirga sp.]|uniref:sigma-70 family RNA polymerase sigma factor n=1 Tax=Aestuariivirga sp. TaxID=2650926 RepID=UPI003BA9DEED